MSLIPEIGSSERNQAEERALERGRQLLHEHEGRVRDALHYLGEEIRDELRREVFGTGPTDVAAAHYCRDYSRALVRHTEQCWATAILR